MFSIKNQRDVSRILDQVREELFKHFVPQHLGPETLSRDDWLKHNSFVAKNLFDASDEKRLLLQTVRIVTVKKVRIITFRGKLGAHIKVDI